MPHLTDQIAQAVRAWPEWSPAEQRCLDAIIDEILAHMREGTGNAFIQAWCARHLRHLIQERM